MVMGRDAVNDIILNDLEISRRHAAITFRGGRYFVEDLGSTNGTFVNGRRVTVATPLKDGDLLDLAQAVTLTFNWPEDPAARLNLSPVLADELVETAPDLNEPVAPRAPRREERARPRPAPEEELEAEPGWRDQLTERQFVIGCLVLLLAVLAGCVASALLLDALAPESLYCGPLQLLFEIFSDNLACP
jgi:hypothetical protein